MIVIVLLSLVAGVPTVLVPCVSPFLLVVVGGGLGYGPRCRPYPIAASLVVSLLVSTLLLKANTAFLGTGPRVWAIGSGVLVTLLGVAMLFPGLWARVARRTKLETAYGLLGKTHNQRGETAGAPLAGAALRSVLSSCSPTYTWVIATVLPVSPVAGVIYLGIYRAGMAGVLLGISLAGCRPIDRLGRASNLCGWLQRVTVALLIVVGLFVSTGSDKALQTWAADKFLALTAFGQGLIPQSNAAPGVAGNTEQQQLGPTPELTGISRWVNSSPTTLANLRGKVALVDFWTYSCTNCMRTQPYLNTWYDRYRAAGPETIGVHAPELTFEKVLENVEKVVRDAGIKHPVALDSDFAIRRAYHSRYWPAKYLTDKDGNVRWAYFGEGSYDEAEKQIHDLLGETGDGAGVTGETTQSTRGQSPETYLGTRRASGDETRLETEERNYGQNSVPSATNRWSLFGSWTAGGEPITAARDGAQLNYRFAGREIFLVMGSPIGAKVRVQVEDGGPPGGVDMQGEEVMISGVCLYRLVWLFEATRGATVTLTFGKGVNANAPIFGRAVLL